MDLPTPPPPTAVNMVHRKFRVDPAAWDEALSACRLAGGPTLSERLRATVADINTGKAEVMDAMGAEIVALRARVDALTASTQFAPVFRGPRYRDDFSLVLPAGTVIVDAARAVLDAIDGQYVTEAEAETRPRETVKESPKK